MPFGKANTTRVIMSRFLFFLDVQLCLFNLLSLHANFLNTPLPLEPQQTAKRALTLRSPRLEHQRVSGSVEADAGGTKRRRQLLTHFPNEHMRGGTDPNPALP